MRRKKKESEIKYGRMIKEKEKKKDGKGKKDERRKITKKVVNE